MISEEVIRGLILSAMAAREYAYAPYSGFAVGAALLATDVDAELMDVDLGGVVVTGCNLENASYPAGICAERTAFSKALSEGYRAFSAIAVIGGKEDDTKAVSPCGICRQFMSEFTNPDTFYVIMASDCDHYKVRLLSELLPDSFGPKDL